ncbi:hypothetical protein QCN27_07510 [Cereibacter sp. SYSU M97828]|nr:hypothetical protein [Cereibacter flavus]
MFRWLFLAAALPGMAFAQGTRHDIGAQAGDFGIDITLPDGIAFSRPSGSLGAGGAEAFVMSQVDARRVAGGITYRFKIDEAERTRATAVWDRHGGIKDFTPSFSFCRTGPHDRKQPIRYSLYRPGFGSTPSKQLSAAGMARVLRGIAPCPTRERAD